MRAWWLLSLGLLATPALADVVNPEEEACEGRSAGDVCDADGRTGRCETGQCCRNRYGGGSDVPTRVCAACLKCQQAPPGAPPPDDDKKSGCDSAPGAPGPLGGLAVLIGLGLAVGLGRGRGRARSVGLDNSGGANAAPDEEDRCAR